MLGSTKFFPLILLLVCSHHSFALAPFDSFHSNLGKIIILTPKTTQTLIPPRFTPEPQKPPKETSAEKVEPKVKKQSSPSPSSWSNYDPCSGGYRGGGYRGGC